MFVYSEISWLEIRSLPIFFACVSTWRYRLRRAATPTVKRSANFAPSSSWSVRDVLSHSASGARDRSRQAIAERVRLDEPRERGLAVDLDHRQPLAVARLELGVAVDLDHFERERQLRADGLDDLERRLAEVATGADEDGDAVQGYG